MTKNRKVYNKLSAVELAEAAERWSLGHETLGQLAARFSVSTSGVHRALKAAGVTKGSARATVPDRYRAIARARIDAEAASEGKTP